MVFEQAIQRLIEFGVYKFILPFILISAIVYALLRKTKILGVSPLINGLVSMAIAFFIFGVPVMTGADLSVSFSSFFKNLSIIILIVVFGLLIAGAFVPNLMSSLVEWMKGGGIIWGVIILVLVVAIMSGMFNDLAAAINSAIGTTGAHVLLVIVIILIFVGIILGVSSGVK